MSLFGNWGQQGQQQQQQQQQPAAGAFGAPQQQPQQPGAFGGGGGFGAAPAFGAQPQPGQASAFGAQPAASGGFGAAGGAFGAQARPAFGAASGAFGAAGAAGSFGGGGFGAATPAPAAGGFGAAPAAGASGSSMFGGAPAATPAAGGFGTGSSLFGAPKQAAAGFGAGAMVPAVQNGTAAPPYEVTQERDTVGAQSVVLHFQSISCMPAYKTQSFEELRVQDYAQGRKTATGFGQTGAFGGQPQQQPQPGLFGAAAPAPGGFGQPAAANPTPSFGAPGNAFGTQQNPASAFGGGGFGAQPQAQQQPAAGFGAAGNAFGPAQPAQQPSLFGGNAAQPNAFGQPAGQTTGFGGAAAGAFGAKPAGFGAGAFGAAPAAPVAPAANFGFAAQPQQQPQQPGSLFGGQSQQPQQPSFGFNTQQPKSLFGAQQPAAAPTFGQQPQDANKPAGSLFGGGAFGAPQQPAQQTPAFGAQPTQQQTPGLFGQQQPTAPSLFGQQQQPQQQQQQAGGFGGGIFGNKPATPTAPSLFGGGGFGQQQPTQQQGVAGINPLTGQPTQSLFGNQQAQPAVTGFGGTSSLFGNKPAATGLFGQQQPAQGAPSLFGPTAGGATGSIFGQSVLGQQQQQQQQQPALVAEIDKPINHGLPVFSLLAPGPRAIPATSTLGNSTATKKQSYFADMPTKAPVPRLGQSSYTPPTAKLRGFAASGSAGSLSGSISNLNISSAPSRNLSSSPFGVSGSSGALTRHPTLSTSLSTMAPEAFATSSSSTSLGGKRQSVKKLVLDKRPSSPTLGSTGDSRPASPSRVSFNPSAGARERERERERTAVPAPAAAPRPPSPAPEVRRAPTPAAASKLGGSGTSGSHTGQSNLQDGYWIRPSLDALSRATSPIHGLTIGRTGYGSVQFIAPVDLKQCPPPADIPGNIVILDNKSCTVYPDEDSKAVEGTGLNVPARIALEGCWVIDKANRQPIKQEGHPKHVAHVRKLKEMSDTGFISFDVTTGTWTFAVEHFSRYGLGEDDDSEDEEERMEDEDAEPDSSPLKGREKPRAPVEKGTPALESPFVASTGAGAARAVSYAVRKGIEQDKVHTMQASLFRVPEARAAAGASKSAKPSPFGPPPPYSSRMDTSESGTSTAAPSAVKSTLSNPLFKTAASGSTPIPVTASASKTALVTIPTQPRAPSATARVNFTRPTATNASGKATGTGIGDENVVFDAGLALGRSFRVSWGPGGQLVGPGRLVKPSESVLAEQLSGPRTSIVTIKRIPNGGFVEAEIRANMKQLIALQRNKSTISPAGDELVPTVETSSNLRFHDFASLFDKAPQSDDALLWRLLVALFDDIPLRLPEGLDPLARYKALAISRRQTLSDWLETAVASSVAVEARDGSVPKRIFSLLSGNQIERAVELAGKEQYLHLATLIAEHGSDPAVAEDLHEQLSLWHEQRVSAQIDPALLRVYALLSGELDTIAAVRAQDPLESIPAIYVTGALDWKRAFGLRLWFGEGAAEHDASLALKEYEEFFGTTKKAPPVRNGERDATFELIRAALRPEIPLDNVLEPKTFAGSAFDFRMTWHIYVMLARVLKQRDFVDRETVDMTDDDFEVVGHSPTADLVTNGYAAQLEAAGLYPEAVFVLLHLEAPEGRVRAIKDLLSHNFTRLDDDDFNQFDQYEIPGTWIEEARAAYLISQDRYFDAFQAAMKAEKEQHLAYRLAVENLVPDAILRDDMELLRTLFASFDASTVDGWAMKGQLFVDYIQVMSDQPDFDTVSKAQQLLAAIPAATSESQPTVRGSKPDARWAACRARMISNLLEKTDRVHMRYTDRSEITLVDDSTRARHVQTLAFDSFISVLG